MNMLKRTSDLHPDEEVLRFLIQALRKPYCEKVIFMKADS